MGSKFRLIAYNTLDNRAIPDQTSDKLSGLKPVLQQLIEAKTHNLLTVQQNGSAIAQYIYNPKKDKWRKSLG